MKYQKTILYIVADLVLSHVTKHRISGRAEKAILEKLTSGFAHTTTHPYSAVPTPVLCWSVSGFTFLHVTASTVWHVMVSYTMVHRHSQVTSQWHLEGQSSRWARYVDHRGRCGDFSEDHAAKYYDLSQSSDLCSFSWIERICARHVHEILRLISWIRKSR